MSTQKIANTHWTEAEKDEAISAYRSYNTSEAFLHHMEVHGPGGGTRTAKAYLTFIMRAGEPRREPLHADLLHSRRNEEAFPPKAAPVSPVVSVAVVPPVVSVVPEGHASNWVASIDETPVQTAPSSAYVSNFAQSPVAVASASPAWVTVPFVTEPPEGRFPLTLKDFGDAFHLPPHERLTLLHDLGRLMTRDSRGLLVLEMNIFHLILTQVKSGVPLKQVLAKLSSERAPEESSSLSAPKLTLVENPGPMVQVHKVPATATAAPENGTVTIESLVDMVVRAYAEHKAWDFQDCELRVRVCVDGSWETWIAGLGADEGDYFPLGKEPTKAQTLRASLGLLAMEVTDVMESKFQALNRLREITRPVR